MKGTEFRKLIREEVRRALKLELQEFKQDLLESIAAGQAKNGTPNSPKYTKAPTGTNKWSVPVRESKSYTGNSILNDLIAQTEEAMRTHPVQSRTGYADSAVTAEFDVIGESSEYSEPTVGIDLNSLGFLGRSKEIFKATQEKNT